MDMSAVGLENPECAYDLVLARHYIPEGENLHLTFLLATETTGLKKAPQELPLQSLPAVTSDNTRLCTNA
jgi:hypothetical protein